MYIDSVLLHQHTVCAWRTIITNLTNLNPIINMDKGMTEK